MKNWFIFIKERFDPVSHLVMILLFLGAHYTLSRELLSNTINTPWSIGQSLSLIAAITLFFFKLRLYDEIKDYPLDQQINPHRPLPRGLLTVRDMGIGIVTCIIFEIVLFYFFGLKALTSMLIAIGYSLLMYKEFFIGKNLRPHLTTYAMTHTLVTILLSMSIFTALWLDRSITELPWQAWGFSLASWLFFNTFEFGRKIYLKEEERNNVPTYSSTFGAIKASILLCSQALGGSIIFAYLVQTTLFWTLASLWAVILIVVCFQYVVQAKQPWGKLLRAFSSGYIVLIYLSVMVSIYLR